MVAYILQANLNCTKWDSISNLPAKTLYRETTKIIIDSLLFLFDRARVQEETSVIIRREKDRTESYVFDIRYVTKLMRVDSAYEFEWT